MKDLAEKLRHSMALEYETVISPYSCGTTPCYVARHPELRGCMSHGDTPEQAVANLRDARELYIPSLLEDGLDVPLPRRSVVASSPGDRDRAPLAG